MPKPINSEKRTTNSGGLQGFPGYRNRDNRSGLDPIDNETELAHMEGSFARRLFTLQLRTRNPLYLVLMFLLGVAPTAISIAVVIASIGQPIPWLPLLLMNAVTLPLAINFFLSLAGFFTPRR
jgi:hypothetical protein